MRQYYVPQITEFSDRELQRIVDTAEPPICLLGGWAVHLHVDDGFQDEHGREYIGSRDIDVGVHVESALQPDELRDRPVAQSIEAIEELGYTKSRFGFVQNFHREAQERLSEEAASQYGMHEVFKLYVDLIPDTEELAAFESEFGFKPPAEPLLRPVFEENAGVALDDHVSWTPPENTQIVPPALLAAMKVKSLPDRDKSHKRVKDVADLHALLWYVADLRTMTTEIRSYVSGSDLDDVDAAVDETVYTKAAQLLQIDRQLIEDSIRQLSHH